QQNPRPPAPSPRWRGRRGRRHRPDRFRPSFTHGGRWAIRNAAAWPKATCTDPGHPKGARGAERSLLRSAPMKVAYQGEPGSYSERAVRGVFDAAEPLACQSVRLVFSRVTSGEAAFGVVPLENSQAGSVNETYELLQHTT